MVTQGQTYIHTSIYLVYTYINADIRTFIHTYMHMRENERIKHERWKIFIFSKLLVKICLEAYQKTQNEYMNPRENKKLIKEKK